MTLDATGLSVPSQADTIASINASIVTDIGPQVQLGPDSVVGRLSTIFSAQTAQSNELLRALYDAMSPDQAEQALLDLICALVLVTRDPAVPSFGTLTITGTPTTIIPSGSIYRVPDGSRFVTTEAAVIPGGGSIDVAIESEIAGAIEAGATTITEPVTIIAGVASVSNAAAVTEGRAIELDAALRQRREASISRPGEGTTGAIRAAILAVDTVTEALVISNDTDATDALGLPPHSFRSVVWPVQADNDPIWLAIWNAAPAGIKSDGAIAGTIPDSQDVSQDVAYSLADEQEIYFDIVVTTDPLTYGGDDAIDATVLAWAALLAIGDDVILHQTQAAISDAVTGILTIELLAAVGIAPGPTDDDNITIALDEIATVDVLNIVVTSS